MADNFTFKVDGLKEVQDALRGLLPDRTARNVMRRVLTKQAKIVAAAAQSKAPKRLRQLEESIQVGKLSARQRAQHRRVDPNDVEVFVGAGVLPHAHLQEYGSSIHGAQPFMRPAWDENKQKIIESIKGDMWQEIRKAAERLARKQARAAGGG